MPHFAVEEIPGPESLGDSPEVTQLGEVAMEMSALGPGTALVPLHSTV